MIRRMTQIVSKFIEGELFISFKWAQHCCVVFTAAHLPGLVVEQNQSRQEENREYEEAEDELLVGRKNGEEPLQNARCQVATPCRVVSCC